MNKTCYALLALPALLIFALSGTASAKDSPRSAPQSFESNSLQALPYPLPSNPEEWVRRAGKPSKAEIATLCRAPRGTPLHIGTPPSIAHLRAKNRFDKKFKVFLNSFEYQKQGWLFDKAWRLTGPVAYKKTGGGGIKNYGIHPAVRIYYSPEAVQWLCDGRKAGEIPNGAMIIKQMVEIGPDLPISPDDNGFVNLDSAKTNAQFMASPQWTVMFKNDKASSDGWYFSYYGATASKGNPPIVNRSAFVKRENPRNPELRPTGPNSVVYPNGIYGNTGCVNCHASAAVENTFITLDNILTNGWRYKWYYQDQKSPTYQASYPGYPKPLKKASQAFLDSYKELHKVKFAAAWKLRLPAETYDHNVGSSNGKQEFQTSDQCFGCHDASLANAWLPNMMLQNNDTGYRTNLSMYGEWKSSPMGLAGRDPIFFSQLQSETNNLPATLSSCVENTCLKCHGVLGQRQFSRDTQGSSHDAEACNKIIYPVQPPSELPTGKLYTLKNVTKYLGKDAKYGALSRDGISCMACHQMLSNPTGKYNDQSNEKYFTGNFLTTSEKRIFGPFADADTVPKPMQHAVGLTPGYGKQIKSSQLCGNCHNIILPVVNRNGKVFNGTNGLPNLAGFEQSTELEWQNSVFGRPGSKQFATCQACHMPHNYKDQKLNFKIANSQSANFPPTTESLPNKDIDLKKVDPYARHTLHGLNVFLNQMFQQFPLILGFRQVDYETTANVEPSLITNQYSMNDMADHETASVVFKKLAVKGDTIQATVKVTNKTGHYFPSGVGFRRAFLEVLAIAKDGSTVWASGRTNKLGQLLDGLSDKVLPGENPVANPKDFQPSYAKITKGNQVQIYQEVILDEEQNITTSFIRRFNHVKDNRIRPQGFDPKFFLNNPSTYVQQLGELHGSVKDDPYYSDPKLTGADEVDYEIKLPKDIMAKVDHLQATVYYQSIPPNYLQERFRDANVGAKNKNEIDHLFYLTSHMNVQTPVKRNGTPYMQDWKLKISSAIVKK